MGEKTLRDDGLEREKQIVATLLKEAEFMRNEILGIGTSARNLFIATVAFVGVLLTVTAGLLSIKASDPTNVNAQTIGILIKTYRWPLLIISFVGVITCCTFLRLFLGSHAGICNAARYYRYVLEHNLNDLLNTGSDRPDQRILFWESWLTNQRQNHGGWRHPGESLIAEPIVISLIGFMFACWGFGIILADFGVESLVITLFSVVMVVLIVGVGGWCILKVRELQAKLDGRTATQQKISPCGLHMSDSPRFR